MLLNIKTVRTILHLPRVDELKQFVDPSVFKYFRVLCICLFTVYILVN